VPPGKLRAALTACALVLAVAGCGAGARTATTTAATAARPARAARRPADAEARVQAALRRLAAYGKPVYCGGRARRWVAFTFDDGPGPYTKLAVRILSAAHVPATFFLVGRNLAPFRSSLRVEEQIGALGDHTWTHPDLAVLAPSAVMQEMASAKQGIERASGRRVQLFRPPYGARDATVDRTARRLGLVEVLWTVDSADSLGANYAQIARNVLAGLRPGAIILMHENRGQTIRALKFYVLPKLRRAHVRLVTVPQLLSGDPPTPAQLARGGRGCGVSSLRGRA
jgi:peptidoglycan/xylan/chitin deacetylase (PgdA/CDA1 family)